MSKLRILNFLWVGAFFEAVVFVTQRRSSGPLLSCLLGEAARASKKKGLWIKHYRYGCSMELALDRRATSAPASQIALKTGPWSWRGVIRTSESVTRA